MNAKQTVNDADVLLKIALEMAQTDANTTDKRRWVATYKHDNGEVVYTVMDILSLLADSFRTVDPVTPEDFEPEPTKNSKE